MHDPTGHPDDERLSALAAGDGDATNDDALRGHVDACARCSAVVADLTALGLALAQLPDIAPPRPLRLLPVARDPSPPTGFRALARRLVAPAFAAGVLLSVAGGAGTYLSDGFSRLTSAGAGVAAPLGAEGASKAAPTAGVDTTDGKASSAPALPDADPNQSAPSPAGSHEPGFDAAQRTIGGAAEPIPGIGWPIILAAGLALVLCALVVRFVVQPRAG